MMFNSFKVETDRVKSEVTVNIEHDLRDDDLGIIYTPDGPWVTCWSCGGEGFHELHDEDPMWYDEDDVKTCDICLGKGGWPLPPETNDDSNG